MVFQIFNRPFFSEPVQTAASVSCSWLSGQMSDWPSAAGAHLLLSVLQFRGCNECFFELPSPVYHRRPVLLRPLASTQLPLTGFFLGRFSAKSQSISRFWNPQSSTDNHSTFSSSLNLSWSFSKISSAGPHARVHSAAAS